MDRKLNGPGHHPVRKTHTQTHTHTQQQLHNMKKSIKSITSAAAVIVTAAISAACCNQQDDGCRQKVEEFATVHVTSPLIDKLGEGDREALKLFRQAGEIIDSLFWKQTFGDKSEMTALKNEAQREFAMINYGPWERLNNNIPFVEGYGDKPLGACYYPADMDADEFASFDNPDKNSLYTVLRRAEDGSLKCVWYRDEYRAELDRICALLEQASALVSDEGLRNYLNERVKAFRTDDYLQSDLAWMDMKNSPVDLVIGPIENYDDKLNEAKASYECFILLKDEERSASLAKYVTMLPALQKMLPCKEEYKTFVPGTSSDLNVYDAIYYSGDCNCGSKTIAINLPNDERVHALKGTRRLQLQNSMKAKFDKILLPIGNELIEESQRQHLNPDAFFWNVTFHEVAHGLGVKETVNGRGSVDEALGSSKTSWEEAKADILGLFMVCKLIDMQEIEGISKEDAIATFIAGIVRSVRFGSASSHGKANMMCFNFMQDNGAFSRNADGLYHIDFVKAAESIDAWANLIITTQATGDREFAMSYIEKNAKIRPELQVDVDRINSLGIPRDIRFVFDW